MVDIFLTPVGSKILLQNLAPFEPFFNIFGSLDGEYLSQKEISEEMPSLSEFGPGFLFPKYRESKLLDYIEKIVSGQLVPEEQIPPLNPELLASPSGYMNPEDISRIYISGNAQPEITIKSKVKRPSVVKSNKQVINSLMSSSILVPASEMSVPCTEVPHYDPYQRSRGENMDIYNKRIDMLNYLLSLNNPSITLDVADVYTRMRINADIEGVEYSSSAMSTLNALLPE
jgi:hypothetical protein